MYTNLKTGCRAIGRAGGDGEYRTVGDKNTPLLTFSLAVGKGDTGDTLWFSCQAWNPVAERFRNRIRKGEVYAVDGVWQSREHNGKTYHTLVVEWIEDMEKSQRIPERNDLPDYAADVDDVLDESELPF